MLNMTAQERDLAAACLRERAEMIEHGIRVFVPSREHPSLDPCTRIVAAAKTAEMRELAHKLEWA